MLILLALEVILSFRDYLIEIILISEEIIFIALEILLIYLETILSAFKGTVSGVFRPHCAKIACLRRQRLSGHSNDNPDPEGKC